MAIEHILYENRLKFSDGRKTNDPREYKEWELEPHLEGDYTHEEFRAEWKEAERSFKKAIRNRKYACFCSNNPDTGMNGYNRLRMWAQYGENFSGACIAFSTNLLKKRLTEKCIQFDAFPVQYMDELKDIDGFITDAEANTFMQQDKEKWANKYIDLCGDFLFFTKHMDYRDENEYRIVINDPNNKFEFLDITGCIKAVLLGDRTKKVYYKIVKQFCDEMNAEYKLLSWQKGMLHLKDI